MAPRKTAKRAAYPEADRDRQEAKSETQSTKSYKTRAKREQEGVTGYKDKSAGGLSYHLSYTAEDGTKGQEPNKKPRKYQKCGKCGLFRACGGNFSECYRENAFGCCVHCNRRGAAVECAHCAVKYHNCCIVQHFRMYGVCVCGMPLNLAPLRGSALHCCYCKRRLVDFYAVFDCGHGACWSCWEKFKLRRQEICAECGAAVVVHLGNSPLATAM